MRLGESPYVDRFGGIIEILFYGSTFYFLLGIQYDSRLLVFPCIYIVPVFVKSSVYLSNAVSLP